MRLSVLDLETQKTFSEVGRDKLHELKVSVAGFYDYPTDSYLTFEENEILRLEEYLTQTDLLIGFNIKSFDLAVLQPYLGIAVTNLPVLDLLEEIKKVRGHRVTLQSLAVATLKESKSGSGWEAVRLFREGRMDELKKYCLDDVRITKDVFEYGRKHSRVFFKSERDFQTYEIPVTWGERLDEFMKKPSAFPTSLF